MTQGHEPHGDGEGREELLIRACGISYGYHRTDSVLPPWLLLSRHRSQRSVLNTSQTRFYGLRTDEGGDRCEPMVQLVGDGFLSSYVNTGLPTG